MENENRKTVVLGEGSCNFTYNDAVIDFQTYENEFEGSHHEESYINVYEGERHIFISREREDDGKASYVLIETDLKTGKSKLYEVSLAVVRDMNPGELDAIKLCKKAAAGEIQ